VDYEELRKVQRLEKASSKLIEVDKNFFFELGNFTKDLESKAKSMEEVKTLENVKKITGDIYERREQKVVVRALRAARTGDIDTEGMTEREKEMLSELVKVMKKYRGSMFPEKPVPVKKKEEPKKEKKEEKQVEKSPEKGVEKELLKVRVSKYIPQFITSHGKFGPYEENAEVSLPREVCNVLVKKGYIEVLE
jgi:DNA replication initiation complex subunit (GINS family)